MFEDLEGPHRGRLWSRQQALDRLGDRARTARGGRRTSPSLIRTSGMEQEAKDLILSLPGAEAFMCDVSKDEEIAQPVREAESALRQAARAGAQRGLRSGRRTERATSSTPRAKASASRTTSACIR